MGDPEKPRPSMDAMLAGQLVKMAERWTQGEYEAEDMNLVRAARRTLELAVLLGVIEPDEAPTVGGEGDD